MEVIHTIRRLGLMIMGSVMINGREGNDMEPDLKYRHRYIEVLCRVVDKYKYSWFIGRGFTTRGDFSFLYIRASLSFEEYF